MNKVVIRKGLFETSSSSEDSLSVYQDMRLYILPKDVYEKFKSGEVYVKLKDTKPSWTNDEDCVIAANEKSITESKIRLESYDDILYKPYYGSDALYYLQHYYTNYSIYFESVGRHYYDVNFFEYENGNDVIFGFYGYIED